MFLLSLMLYQAIEQSTIDMLSWLILKKYHFFHVSNSLFKIICYFITNVYRNWLQTLHILTVMKLSFSGIILTIVKLFDIKHFTILQNTYLSSLKNSVSVTACLLKIFADWCCTSELLLILVRFIKLLIIRMMRFFMHVNVTELWKSFAILILLLLKSYLMNYIFF